MGFLRNIRRAGLVSLLAVMSVDYRPETTIRVVQGSGQVYSLSREDGERDLIELARYSDIEDSWIFADNKWYDIGVNETRFGVMSESDSLYQSLVNKTNIAVLFFYHIHPKKSTSTNGFNPPSMQDIEHFLFEKRKFLNLANVIGNVVDGNGVWTYDLTNSAKASIKSYFLDFFLENDEPFYVLTPEMCKTIDDAYEKLFQEARTNEKLTRERKTQKFIEMLERCGIVVIYRQLRD